MKEKISNKKNPHVYDKNLSNVIGTYEGYEIIFWKKEDMHFNKFAVIIYSNLNVKIKSGQHIFTGEITIIEGRYWIEAKEAGTENVVHFRFENLVGNKTILFGYHQGIVDGISYVKKIILERSKLWSFDMIKCVQVSVNSFHELEEYTQPGSQLLPSTVTAAFTKTGTRQGETIIDLSESEGDVLKLIQELRNEIEILKNEQSKTPSNVQPQKPEIQEKKTHLKRLLSQNQTKEVIQELMEHYKIYDELRHDDLVILKSRFERLDADSIRNLISRDQYEISISQINNTLIKMINLIEE